MAISVFTDGAVTQDTRTLSWTIPTLATNDVVVVVSITWDQPVTLNTPAGSGLTFPGTPQVNCNAASRVRIYMWGATASSGGSSVNVTASVAAGGNSVHTGVLLLFPAADGYSLAGTPNTALNATVGAGSAPSVNLAGTSGSIGVIAVGEWNGANLSTRAWLASATEDLYAFSSGNSTQLFGHATLTGASTTLGLSTPTANGYSIAAMEILATGGGAAPAGDVAAPWLLTPPGRIAPNGRLNAWQGPLDSGTAYTQQADDSTGLADAIALELGKAVTDSTGLTDSTVIDRAAVTTDTTGLVDTTVLDRGQVVDDSTGLTDSATVSFVKSQTVTDDTGLTDSTSIARGYGVTQDDPTGLTDSLAVDRAQVVTDSTGLTDSATPAVGIARTVDDTTGLTDSLTIDNGKVVSIADATGLTDATTLDRGLVSTDTTGLADSVSLSLSRAVTDTAGLSDSVVVENGKAIAATDTTGLTDTVVLQLFKAITDTAGLSDLAALTRGLVTTDSTGLTDSIDVQLIGASVGTPAPERLVVEAESRTLVVERETRTLLVEAEDRRTAIDRETRHLEA